MWIRDRVKSLTITAKGSVGGGTSGGKGATVKATFAVTPGALLKIVVGAKGRSSTDAVSYTHLDVYKRQRWYSSDLPNQALPGLSLIHI